MKKGTKVRIKIHAGLLSNPRDSKFAGDCVPGAEGIYCGPHPTKHLAACGWHLVQVGQLYAPLHESHYDSITEKGGAS